MFNGLQNLKGKKMKLDTSKNGLHSVWKLYQIAIIELLAGKGPMGSAAIYNELMAASIPISRAMIIQFLNGLEIEGFVSHTMKSGKGGFGKIYKLEAEDEKDFHRKTILHILNHLTEAYKEIVNIEWSFEE